MVAVQARSSVPAAFDAQRHQALYQANRATLGPLAGMLEQMWAGRLDRLAELAESEEGSA
jgi:hypothetical protein